jgi:Flp pilus assembly protein TadG
MDAQAVIETAIVIPILLALISAFLAVMVQVSAQQEMDAATKLAAESFFQAPRLATDSIGTTCCPQSTGAADSLDTSGMPKGCRFAAETFYAPKARGPSRSSAASARSARAPRGGVALAAGVDSA